MSRRHGMGGLGSAAWRGQHNDEQAAIASAVQAKFLRKSKRQWDKAKAKEAPPAIFIRPMVIDDCAFVLDSWANSYRRSPATGPIEREVFNIEQRARINRLISRAASRVMVASLEADKRVIVGWICFEAPAQGPKADGIPIVHYVCVKPTSQLQGVGTGLVGLARQTAQSPELPMWSTHETAPMRHIRDKWNLLFNPYLLELPDRTASASLKDLRP